MIIFNELDWVELCFLIDRILYWMVFVFVLMMKSIKFWYIEYSNMLVVCVFCLVIGFWVWVVFGV